MLREALPQIIYLALMFLALGMDMMQHGKEKEDKHNFWATLIATILQAALLWWGGWFDVFLAR